MARIRSIKPDFFTSEKIAALPISARLTFIGLWTHADDNGVCIDNERLIVAAIWPLEEDPMETLKRTHEDLMRLQEALLVARYEVAGKRYLHIVNWDEHQKVQHPGKPRYPTPDDAAATLLTSPDASSSGSSCDPHEDVPRSPAILTPEQGAGSREQGAGSRDPDGGASAAGTGSSKTRRGTRIPADFGISPEMSDWGREKCPHVNGRAETEKFINYWTAKSGRDAAKLDWLATWRNWMLTAEERAPRSGFGSRSSPAPARRSATDDAIATVQALKQQHQGQQGQHQVIEGSVAS